jgi:hypothetical protein
MKLKGKKSKKKQKKGKISQADIRAAAKEAAERKGMGEMGTELRSFAVMITDGLKGNWLDVVEEGGITGAEEASSEVIRTPPLSRAKRKGGKFIKSIRCQKKTRRKRKRKSTKFNTKYKWHTLKGGGWLSDASRSRRFGPPRKRDEPPMRGPFPSNSPCNIDAATLGALKDNSKQRKQLVDKLLEKIEEVSTKLDQADPHRKVTSTRDRN